MNHVSLENSVRSSRMPSRESARYLRVPRKLNSGDRGAREGPGEVEIPAHLGGVAMHAADEVIAEHVEADEGLLLDHILFFQAVVARHTCPLPALRV